MLAAILSIWTKIRVQMLWGDILYPKLPFWGIWTILLTSLRPLLVLFLPNLKLIVRGQCEAVTAHVLVRRLPHQHNIAHGTSNLFNNAPPLPLHKQGLEEDSNKENHSPGPSTSPLKKRKYKTTDQKLYDIFKVIRDANWALSDFLYFAFRHKNTNGEDIHCEPAHSNMVQKFLAGNCVHTPARMLDSWYHSKDGRHEDKSPMFSTTTSFTEIRGIRECLTCSSNWTAIGAGSDECSHMTHIFQWPPCCCGFSRASCKNNRSILSRTLQIPSICIVGIIG
jgi:hypothetical protein